MSDNGDNEHDHDEDRDKGLRVQDFIRPNIDVEFGVIQYEIIRIAHALHEMGWLLDHLVQQLEPLFGLIVEYLLAQRTTVVRHTATVTVDQHGHLGAGHHGAGEVIYTAQRDTRLDKLTIVTRTAPDEPLTTGSMWLYRNQADPAKVEMFLPVSGVVAPVIVAGLGTRLEEGDTLLVTGEDLPTHLEMWFNFDLEFAEKAPPVWPPT